MNILTDYKVGKVLGQGSEGTVYLVQDRRTFKKLVLKFFREPHTSDWLPGLPVYADRIKPNDLGLPVVTLLYNGDVIIGLVYPYVRLSPLHWRILNSSETVAQSLVGSYCRKQYYLMSEHGLALYDPVLPNLMVDGNGRWHYMDIGGGICLLNDPWVLRHGEIGYGFASMLLSVYNKALHQLMMPADGYSYDDRCVYCMNEWLDTIAKQHEWVQEILSEVRSHKASIFYDPEFYRGLADRLPDRVPWPSFILPVSKTLSWLGKLRGQYMGLLK